MQPLGPVERAWMVRSSVPAGAGAAPAAARHASERSLRSERAISHGWSTGSSMARALSSRRLRTPSLRKIAVRWASTVRGLMNSLAARSRFDAPLTTSRATCSSCGVSSWCEATVVADDAAGGPQLGRRPLGEDRRADAAQQLDGPLEVGPGLGPPAGPAQPLAPQDLGAPLADEVAGRGRGRRRSSEVLRRLVVVVGEHPLRPAEAVGPAAARSARDSSSSATSSAAPVRLPSADQRLGPLRLPAHEARARSGGSRGRSS